MTRKKSALKKEIMEFFDCGAVEEIPQVDNFFDPFLFA